MLEVEVHRPEGGATPAADVAAEPIEANAAIERAFAAVQALREVALAQASHLAQTYAERREELRLSVGTGFIGIELYVRARNDNRSIGLEWQKGHYRNGVRQGTSGIGGKKRGSASYDLNKLKAVTPEWAFELVAETEREARLIREALMRLTDADTNLQVACQRLARLGAATSAEDPFAALLGSDPNPPNQDHFR